MKPEFEQALAEVNQFIEYNFERLQVIVDTQWPLITSYSIKSASEIYDQGWLIGFSRCLAEIKRRTT